MPQQPNWQQDTLGSVSPIGQGDLVVVGWAKTIGPDEMAYGGRERPTIGQRDEFDLSFWPTTDDTLEMCGRLNYGLAVVISEGCAIDKEFNTLREKYLATGHPVAQATERAMAEAGPFVTVAEAWPVAALPTHLQDDAQRGALGYVPFSIREIVLTDQRPWIVDLNRVATISWRAIDRRLGVAQERWSKALQLAICRFFAWRRLRPLDDIADIFQNEISLVEVLSPPKGSPLKTVVRITFSSGRDIVVEAVVGDARSSEEPDGGRPALQTRR